MENSTLLSKTVLAFLFARQDLSNPPTIAGKLANSLSGELDLLTKRSHIDKTQIENLQQQLRQFLASHPEWQQKYEGWLEKLKTVQMTSAWLPTEAEINQMFLPPTQSYASLVLSDQHWELGNGVLPIASKSSYDVLNGQKQPEEIGWLQRIRQFFVPAKGGNHVGK